MNIFEEVTSKFLAMLNNNNNQNGWVEWTHEGSTPARTSEAKAYYAAAGTNSKHCAKCMNLNGCWFLRSKMPELPLHPNCHCKVKDIDNPISGVSVIAECVIDKFTQYIFHLTNNGGKKALFENWGYGIMDSKELQTEFIRQAQKKYADGEYELGRLNDFGQRINIIILLLTSNGDYATFRSGWMVYPDGKIRLTTPFGGKIK